MITIAYGLQNIDNAKHRSRFSQEFVDCIEAKLEEGAIQFLDAARSYSYIDRLADKETEVEVQKKGRMEKWE